MADFTLEPDALEPARPERRAPVRLVGTGLAPMAEVPRLRTRRSGPPATRPVLRVGILC
jgi:hypothetical protein